MPGRELTCSVRLSSIVLSWAYRPVSIQAFAAVRRMKAGVNGESVRTT